MGNERVSKEQSDTGRFEFIPTEGDPHGWLQLNRNYDQGFVILGLATFVYLDYDKNEPSSFRIRVQSASDVYERILKVSQVYRLGDLPIKIECKRKGLSHLGKGRVEFYFHAPKSIGIVRTELLESGRISHSKITGF